jgi:molybdopterin-containing oxidoreductase family iron-sulfur binding subunit
VFGDLNDENSEVAKLRATDERNYFVLDELGVKPTVSYLTKVRNCEAEAVEEKKEEPVKEKA